LSTGQFPKVKQTAEEVKRDRPKVDNRLLKTDDPSHHPARMREVRKLR